MAFTSPLVDTTLMNIISVVIDLLLWLRVYNPNNCKRLSV